MKKLLLILLITFTYSPFIFSQQGNAILYEDPSLTIKPSPVDKEIYDEWIKQHNKLYGSDPSSGPGVLLRVVIVFTVDTIGNVVNPLIWRGIGFGYDEEARRLIKANPNIWTPGSMDGKLVNTSVYYMIDFTTNKNCILTKNSTKIKPIKKTKKE
jgi:hypothetical protein